MTITFFMPISTVKLIITGYKATEQLAQFVANEFLHYFTGIYAHKTALNLTSI